MKRICRRSSSAISARRLWLGNVGKRGSGVLTPTKRHSLISQPPEGLSMASKPYHSVRSAFQDFILLRPAHWDRFTSWRIVSEGAPRQFEYEDTLLQQL